MSVGFYTYFAAARLLRAILLFRREKHDDTGDIHKPYMDSLLRALTHVTSTYPGFVGKDSEKLLENPRDELHSRTSMPFEHW